MGWDDIIAWVEGFFQAFADFIVQIADALYSIIVDAANFIWTALQDFWGWLDGVWEAIKGFFDDLWWEVIEPLIEKLQQILDDITTWLQDHFEWLINIWNKALSIYKHYIYPILHDFLEVIQRMRVILELFRLMGFQWAAKLDADLMLIQNYVSDIILEIAQTVNAISTAIGLVLDPSGILRRDFFPDTAFSSLSAIKRANGFGTDRASTPDEQKLIDQANNAVRSGGPLLTYDAAGHEVIDPAVTLTQSQIDAVMAAQGMPVYAH